MACQETCSKNQTKWIIASVAILILLFVTGLMILHFKQHKVTQPGRGLPAMPSCWLPPLLTPFPNQGLSPCEMDELSRTKTHPHPHLHSPLPLPTTPRLLASRSFHSPSFPSPGFSRLKTTPYLSLQPLFCAPRQTFLLGSHVGISSPED